MRQLRDHLASEQASKSSTEMDLQENSTWPPLGGFVLPQQNRGEQLGTGADQRLHSPALDLCLHTPSDSRLALTHSNADCSNHSLT